MILNKLLVPQIQDAGFGDAHRYDLAYIIDNLISSATKLPRVMNLALPNVMRVLRTRYDMIDVLLQTAPKVHHNYAKRIITHNLP